MKKISIFDMPLMLLKRAEIGLSQEKIIEMCFMVIEKHCDIVEQSLAAVILAGIVSPGLGEKTRQFLKENPNLPERAREVLSSAIMRMEGF